jgi:hypothetical protein
MIPYAAGSVEEQRNVVPPGETPLAAIFEQLESEEVALKEGAILWLLRANKAEDIGPAPFPKLSIRFGVDRVTKKEAGGIIWRLVECGYLSRTAAQSHHTEYRALARVAWLFDDLGHLRDWFEFYDALAMDDFNADGRIDVGVAVGLSIFEVVPVTIYTYDRGRTRILLHLDSQPINQTTEKRPDRDEPFEVIDSPDGVTKAFNIRGRGTYVWSEKQQRYELKAE